MKKNDKIITSRQDIQTYLGVGAAVFKRLMTIGLPVIRIPDSNQLIAYADNLDEFIKRLTARQNKINLEEIDDVEENERILSAVEGVQGDRKSTDEISIREGKET
jgi:hypothetical protein